MITEFLISKEFSTNLATRKSATNLFSLLKEKKINILNFDGVETISRSFANQFVLLEKENNYFFEKINMSKDIKYMLENADKKLNTDILTNNSYRTISLNNLMSKI